MDSICYERARTGDPRATRELVEALRPRLTKMAAYYARCSGEDTDDLLQEAWVGLLESLPEMDIRIGSPEHYLVQRARWRLLDAVKRARIRRCSPLDDTANEHVADPAVECAVSSAFLSEFARQLGGTQRAVLECLMKGFTWREAGAVLGCTSANIAYHVRQIQRQYAVWCGGAPSPNARPTRIPVKGESRVSGVGCRV